MFPTLATRTDRRPSQRFALALGLALVTLTAAGTLLTTTGCKSKPPVVDENAYSRKARLAFEEGEEALDAGYHKEALAAFQRVINRYPQSKFATMAELKLADTHFARESFGEAADTYKLFAQRHPGHEKVPYALYRVGLSYYGDRPSEMFFMPPSYEYDQTSTENAVKAFREYLRQYPEDANADDARKKVLDLRTQLAKHEIYVAGFYRRRDAVRATIQRFEIVRKKFYDLPVAQPALLDLGETYEQAGEFANARDLYLELQGRYKDTETEADAAERLAALTKAHPELATPATAAPAPPGDTGGGIDDDTPTPGREARDKEFKDPYEPDMDDNAPPPTPSPAQGYGN
jgi:outer membrane protein assembly factor BamD